MSEDETLKPEGAEEFGAENDKTEKSEEELDQAAEREYLSFAEAYARNFESDIRADKEGYGSFLVATVRYAHRGMVGDTVACLEKYPDLPIQYKCEMAATALLYNREDSIQLLGQIAKKDSFHLNGADRSNKEVITKNLPIWEEQIKTLLKIKEIPNQFTKRS